MGFNHHTAHLICNEMGFPRAREFTTRYQYHMENHVRHTNTISVLLYDHFQDRKLEIKDDVSVGIRKVFLFIILTYKDRFLNSISEFGTFKVISIATIQRNCKTALLFM